MSCSINPVSAFMSTNLNSKIDCYGRLADRIVRALGAPLISIEVHQDQIFENISIACEMYSKYAGYSREYLIFDSRLYQRGKGLRIDQLYTLSNLDLDLAGRLNHNTLSRSSSPYLTEPDPVYVVQEGLTAAIFSSVSAISSNFSEGLKRNQLLDKGTFNLILSTFTTSTFFTPSSSIYDTLTAYYTAQSPVPSAIFASSSSLSVTYANGLSAGYVLNQSQYNTITSFSSSYHISSFFSLSADNNILNYPLSSTLFVNSVVLSSLYTNGLSAGSLLLDSDYSILSSNFDGSNSNFYYYTPLSTHHIDLYYTLIDGIQAKSFSGTVLSGYSSGLSAGDILNESRYLSVLNVVSYPLSGYVEESYMSSKQSCGSGAVEDNSTFNNMFDYDVLDYRKVMSITEFEEGSSSGINTLFTIEQTLAQQTYFSYAMGNYGFDLISWYCVKNWLETREKVLATRRSIDFNPRTQILRIYPEPTDNVRFYGILAAYVEAPIKDMIKEIWPYQYALALTKITVGTVRGKYGSTQMFGGQIFSQDLLTQGLAEKAELEQKLFEGAAAGYGDGDFIHFRIG